MNPNLIHDWYLFSANKGKYTFKKNNTPPLELVVEANSWDEAKHLLEQHIQNSV